jgi:hypothetical protein
VGSLLKYKARPERPISFGEQILVTHRFTSNPKGITGRYGLRGAGERWLEITKELSIGFGSDRTMSMKGDSKLTGEHEF